MPMKISIIGCGIMGSHIAQLIAYNNITESMILVDSNTDKAGGEAMDLNQMLSILNYDLDVIGTNDYNHIKDSNVVVITVGQRRIPGMIRKDLFPINMEKVKAVSRKIRMLAPNSVVIVVTNPSDEMTEVVFRNTLFPKERVIGIGNSLDTARFKQVIHEKTGLPRRSIDCIVVGEHGENMEHYCKFKTPEMEELSRSTAIRTIEKKGSTVFAPALATYQIIESIIRDDNKWYMVASHIEAENKSYGKLWQIGRNGIVHI
jgi:malate dehydrogenase